MNEIERVRSETLKYFDEGGLISGSESESVSPCGKYRLRKSEYRQIKPDCHWDVARYQIFETASDHLIFEFIADDTLSDDSHVWIAINGVDYLVCAEDRFGGHSIFDLTNRKFASFSNGEDGFIACRYYPSPGLTKLALYGCFWACPFEVIVVSFGSPMSLPWPELATISHQHDWIIEWIDDSTLRVGPSVHHL
ncbi:MAG: hypothetical protein IPK58_07140 [Acidobacteria bacterium]|nr:hypothetical protein [Acidobacteriota bacterium]